MQFLYTLAIVFVAFGLSFLLINIRHLLTGREFRGSCATNNPMIKGELGECTVCGRKADEPCGNPSPSKA